ncbi:MAG: stalk domain-containing protein [Bacillota bacterium]|nr:stalk domain-containing protein [Bacillota bacterium]
MINWKKFAQLLLASTLICALMVLPASAASAVRVTIDGQAVAFDSTYGEPFIDSANRTQVPFRKTLETFGCTVSWEDATRTAVAEKDGVTVRVPIGQAYIEVNGVRETIDTSAIIVNDRTYLPIRAVLEAFGAQVSWNDATRCVVVTTGAPVLRVHFIDVGQGDATLIDYGEMEVLIDGGDNKAGATVVSYLSSYVDGPLDYLIATHPDADHVGGLDDVLAAFQVSKIIDSGYPSSTKTYQSYWNAAQTEPNSALSYDEDRVISLGPEAFLTVIETGDDWTTSNDSSVICQLVCGDVTVLFTGDMSQNVERASLSLFGDVDVLKVGHHGSASSTCKEFLEVVRPEYAVASYLVGNSYHHPTAKALQRLFDQGTTVYGTGKSGTIILTTDGQTYSFNTDQALTLADAGA